MIYSQWFYLLSPEGWREMVANVISDLYFLSYFFLVTNDWESAYGSLLNLLKLLNLSTDCKQTALGEDYQGTVSVTENGLVCQRWDQQTPQKHDYGHDNKYPDGSVSAAANYCR